MTPCPDCNGEGYTHYYDGEGNEITKEAYNLLPTDCRDREICDHCEGTGEIEEDNEIDYDHYDD
jgi:DnaJ-class molecular chaperone